MRGVLSVLIGVLALVRLPADAAERFVVDLDEQLVVSGEDVVVTGLWQIASEELSASAPALKVENGNLRFVGDARFQTDDLSTLDAQTGVWLWQVDGGAASGSPALDPPSESWKIVVSEDGRAGHLKPIAKEAGLWAAFTDWCADLGEQFRRCFVANQRWRYITDGLLVTLQVALSAVLIGAFIGFVVAIIRSTHDKSGRFPVLNALMKAYLTVIRGTPMAVQLLIAYFIIFSSCTNKTLVATLAFGLNSGAYVAEIMRAGIVSIDPGQMEAGRSLGLSYARTMIRIILPQAVRNVLPALGNEFIVLLKDTSIASFIALQDLAKGGEIIRSQTYNVYMPFLMVAAVYLVLVVFFTRVLGKFERYLRNIGADVVGNIS